MLGQYQARFDHILGDVGDREVVPAGEVDRGRVVDANFDSYQLMRIDEMPIVENHIVPSYDFWGGIGEAGVPPIAPAICNAIFAATGRRIRSLPLKHHKLTKA